MCDSSPERKAFMRHLEILVESVFGLHERFGVPILSTHADVRQRVVMQLEEVRELLEATDEPSDGQLAEEAVDVLYVAVGTVMLLDPETAIEAMDMVVWKNNGKTLATHTFSERGKVKRKQA